MNIKPINNELENCRAIITQSLHHTNPLLNSVLTTVGARTGKLMRPVLVLLSAKLHGEINERVLRVATGYELLHTASLIHDDVVDESDERRGQESVRHAENNKVAVLVGDYILGEAIRHLASVGSPQIVDIMSSSAQDLSHGELLQLFNIQNQDISEETYYDIIRNKTATLFAACAKSGAVAVGANADDTERMRLFGELVGMVFQIKDDIFDYNNINIGKPTGNDMREGKLTLPAIHAILNTRKSGSITDSIEEIVAKVKQVSATESDIQQLIQYTKTHGGIEYSINCMNRFADQAHQLLSVYPDSETITALHDYIDFVIQREY